MLPAVHRAPTLLRESVLFAVLRGSVTIGVRGTNQVLGEWEGMWIPAGNVVSLAPTPGSLVLPVPANGGARTNPTPVRIAQADLPTLVRAFTHALGYLDLGEAVPVELEGVLPKDPAISPPPAPHSTELRALTAYCEQHPGIDIATAIAQTISGWSLRTIQRRFQDETGLTLAAWLRRARVHMSTQYLAAGRDLEWIAHTVGYQSLGGFIRAFAEVTGSTPGQWREPVAQTGNAQSHATIRTDRTDTLRESRTWSRVNGAHVAVWAAVGPSELTVLGKMLELREGEAVIIPAGARNSLRIPAGSLLVPIGYRSGREGGVGIPVTPAHLGNVTELDLIGSMLAAYTAAGAIGVELERGFNAVLAGSVQAPVTDAATLVGRLASICSREPGVVLGQAAERLDTTERELRDAVSAVTGEPYAVWSRFIRMTRARARLGDGETPSEISRALGYAHLPAFSRAFREVHGTAPGELSTPNVAAALLSWGKISDINMLVP